MFDVRAIAEHPAVTGLAAGDVDLGAELGMTPSDDEREWLAARSQLVWASAAAGLMGPIGAPSTDFNDAAAITESTDRLRRLGFSSRFAIHPAQIGPINSVFTPSADDVERALRLVRLFDTAVERGAGVVVDEDGRMVDEAVVRHARTIITRSAAATTAD